MQRSHANFDLVGWLDENGNARVCGWERGKLHRSDCRPRNIWRESNSTRLLGGSDAQVAVYPWQLSVAAPSSRKQSDRLAAQTTSRPQLHLGRLQSSHARSLLPADPPDNSVQIFRELGIIAEPAPGPDTHKSEESNRRFGFHQFNGTYE